MLGARRKTAGHEEIVSTDVDRGPKDSSGRKPLEVVEEERDATAGLVGRAGAKGVFRIRVENFRVKLVAQLHMPGRHGDDQLLIVGEVSISGVGAEALGERERGKFPQ